jgi:SAM-dependent methyltransferase
MAATISTPATADERRDALVERLFMATVGAMDVLGVYIGDRLGLYRALAERGPSTSQELAGALGLSERYVREWLEQQAASGILELDAGSGNGAQRRYSMPAGHGEALLDETSVNLIAPVGQLVVACVRPMDAVLQAFRTGDGVPYADYGADLHEGQARFTRPMFDHLLASEWLPAVPQVHERLQADPPARVADVACGEGRSSIAIARGYPKVQVDGIEMDAATIEAARRHLEGSGVEDQVSFHLRDAADQELAGCYDLVYIHEALHDMSYPVRVLSACCGLLAEGGSVVVGDERVPDEFDPPSDEVERLYYGFSVLHCLPVGMVGEGAAGTGTVMRAGTVRQYAEQAGFTEFEVLPIENDFYRFYRLAP